MNPSRSRAALAQTVLKGAAGFLIGLAVWMGLSEPYTRLLASVSQTAIRLGERPSVTSIIPQGTTMVVNRTDFPRWRAERLAVRSTDITFNFILLITLFAASRPALSDRNVAGLAVASIVLVIVHIAVVISFVEADAASSLGPWSDERYGPVARAVWGAIPFFYSVVGVYGFPFALWWLFRPTPETSSRPPTRKRTKASTKATG